MKGMQLSREYYETCKAQMLSCGLEEFRNYIAAGLVGEGSECYGYDDDVSQDHDFGPDFCIWIPEALYQKNKRAFESAYASLPEEYKGYSRNRSKQMMSRRGIMTIEGFYRKYTGITHMPEDAMEWLRIPQSFLSTATNGEIFEDPYGEFTSRRNQLLSYYPEDVIRKKLAAKLVIMGQSGQYNYIRCCRREEWGGAYLAAGEFVKATLQVVYLLNKKYMPYYKWAFREAEKLQELCTVINDLKVFIRMEDRAENVLRKRILIENICNEAADTLRKKGYSSSTSDFLEVHGQSVMTEIRDERLREMHVLADCE
ncbi:MAG: DUF4037 domain-containing protein [Lachnospiraceae bacterium]